MGIFRSIGRCVGDARSLFCNQSKWSQTGLWPDRVLFLLFFFCRQELRSPAWRSGSRASTTSRPPNGRNWPPDSTCRRCKSKLGSRIEVSPSMAMERTETATARCLSNRRRCLPKRSRNEVEEDVPMNGTGNFLFFPPRGVPLDAVRIKSDVRGDGTAADGAPRRRRQVRRHGGSVLVDERSFQSRALETRLDMLTQ